VVKLVDVFSPDDFKYASDDSYVMNGYQMAGKGVIFSVAVIATVLRNPKPLYPTAITEVKYTNAGYSAHF